MSALDDYYELDSDAIASDPDYAIGVIRAYINGGYIPTAGLVLSLLAEIERLNEAVEALDALA
jgi:hypothetical protein